MNNTKQKLIEKLENTLCMFDYSCQECLEEVETICTWFDINEQEKKEIVQHFVSEWSDEQWVIDMVQQVLTYIKFDPELVS